MFGVDPKMLAAAQELGSQVNGKIIVDYKENEITLKLEPRGPNAQKSINFIMESFPASFGQQLTMFFGIRGELIKRGAPAKDTQSGNTPEHP
jgi:hypothetical protein